jgi:hypothetical protein
MRAFEDHNVGALEQVLKALGLVILLLGGIGLIVDGVDRHNSNATAGSILILTAVIAAKNGNARTGPED